MNMEYKIPNITEAQKDTLLEVPVMVTYLIAGADNNIDKYEKEWAENLLDFRATRNSFELRQYYDAAERVFSSAFKKYESELAPYKDVESRNHYLSDKLTAVNSILSKLEPHLAEELVKSFRTYARQVAKSSGGLLGFGAISPEENKWIDLKMLQYTVSSK